MKEFPEMMHQYEMDYFFDSSKFEKRFEIPSTKPEDGIKIMVNNFNKIKIYNPTSSNCFDAPELLFVQFLC
jgi:hypothetical protein